MFLSSPVYSPNVLIYLRIGEKKIRLANVLYDSAVLYESAEVLPNTEALLVISIDGDEERKKVILDKGISIDQKRIAFSYSDPKQINKKYAMSKFFCGVVKAVIVTNQWPTAEQTIKPLTPSEFESRILIPLQQGKLVVPGTENQNIDLPIKDLLRLTIIVQNDVLSHKENVERELKDLVHAQGYDPVIEVISEN